MLYVNQHYADSIGIEKHTNVIGLTSKNLPSTSSRCADKFDEQDVTVMRSGRHFSAYCFY